jgi:hypothetical protein
MQPKEAIDKLLIEQLASTIGWHQFISNLKVDI